MNDYPEYFNREGAQPALSAAMGRYLRGKRLGDADEMVIAEKIMYIYGAKPQQCQTPARWMWDKLSPDAKEAFRLSRAAVWDELFLAGEIEE